MVAADPYIKKKGEFLLKGQRAIVVGHGRAEFNGRLVRVHRESNDYPGVYFVDFEDQPLRAKIHRLCLAVFHG